jgi:hypothetical protein
MKFCISFMEATCVAQRLIDIITLRLQGEHYGLCSNIFCKLLDLYVL